MRAFEKHSELIFDVAVSIVVYHNSPDELAGLLRSLSQTCRNVHITVVDNSSTPALQPIAMKFGAHYLHMEKNVGFGAAHNVAIRKTLANAKYHAVINPDISFESDTLHGLFEFMEAHPQIGQAMPAILNPDGTEQRLAKRLPTPFDLFLRRFVGRAGKVLAPRQWARYETRDLDLSICREIPCLSGCFMFLRTSMLQEVGLFDERYFLYMEDFDLCRRIGAVGKTVIYPEITVVHRYGRGSYREFRSLALHLKAAVRYFQKWGWFMDKTRGIRNRSCGTTIPIHTRAVPSNRLKGVL